MDAISRTRQHNVAAWSVVVARNSIVQNLWVLRISFGQNRRPAGISPKRILIVFRPFLQIIAASQSDSASFVEPIPSPITEPSFIKFDNREGVGEFIALPSLGIGHDMPGLTQLQIGNRPR